MSEATTKTQEERFDDTPAGWAQRWRMEFDAARKEHSDWQDKGQKIVERFLDKREGQQSMPSGVDTRWNFFTANVQTMECMLYGKTPAVDVTRRFADSADEVARIAAELGERVLNSDIERVGDGFATALGLCLKDRLLPGVGVLRFRYVPDWEEVEGKEAMVDEEGRELAPAVDAYQRKAREEVETDYVHWKDVLWSPCRTFHEMRWCAFRAQLTREQLEERFGEEEAAKIALNTKKNNGQSDATTQDPWSRADVWEIWDKEHECVWFFIEGHPTVLVPKDVARDEEAEEEEANEGKADANGSTPNPLGLEGFWPFPRFMVANLTTSAFVPRADFTLAQDLYDEIDRVSTRITELERAIGAKGGYDKTNPALARLLTEATNNKLLPIENWAAFSEKGGFKGAFELMPLEGLVGALDRLCEYRQELIQAAYQLTGMSDIVRGEASDAGATATEQSIKAKFASVRMQALQDEFARFASDAQRIRLEIIARHFDAQTILQRSNIGNSLDAQNPLLLQAVELLKSETACYRVEVKPEAVSLNDFAALKTERMEVIEGIGGFVQQAAPLVQMLPGAMPVLLELLEALVASMRGGQELGGILQRAAKLAAQMPPPGQQPPQQDPKLQTQLAKNQGEAQKIQLETQSEMVRQEHETQQLALRQQQAAQINVAEEAQKLRLKHMATMAEHAMAPPTMPGGLP